MAVDRDEINGLINYAEKADEFTTFTMNDLDLVIEALEYYRDNG